MKPEYQNLLNELRRLERIGAEDSLWTQKLLQAAEKLSQGIAARFGLTGGEKTFDFQGDRYAVCKYTITPVGLNRNGLSVSATREAALEFSRDIANGLLFAILTFRDQQLLKTVAAESMLTAANLLLEAEDQS